MAVKCELSLSPYGSNPKCPVSFAARRMTLHIVAKATSGGFIRAFVAKTLFAAAAENMEDLHDGSPAAR